VSGWLFNKKSITTHGNMNVKKKIVIRILDSSIRH